MNDVKKFVQLICENSITLKNNIDTLEEMPIKQFKTVGDWSKRSSFSDVDRALLTSPKAVSKIHNQFSKTHYDFEFYLVNDKRVNKSDFREVGEIPLSFVREKMKLSEKEIPNPDSNAITVIYTSNVGDQRYMATGWILAHRMAHAFARRYTGPGQDGTTAREWEEFTYRLRQIVVDILDQVYEIDVSKKSFIKPEHDKILKYVAQELGTMKSARDKKLRNWYEFAYELFAQYLLTGAIKLNPLPNNIITGVAGWGRKQTRYAKYPKVQAMYNNHDLEYYADEMESLIDNVLSRAIGKIYVM